MPGKAPNNGNKTRRAGIRSGDPGSRSRPRVVDLRILDKSVRVHCPEERFERWIRDIYRSMQDPVPPPAAPDLEYRIEQGANAGEFRVSESDPAGELPRIGEPDPDGLVAQTAGKALSLLEDSLTIALQLMRPDLLFVHAAALADERGVIAFVGESGAGKSTLAWALAHRGFTYLSDELAPFDVATAHVLPFSRAIHLKTLPPGASSPPPETIDTGRALCVPVASLGEPADRRSRELRALFFLGGAVQTTRHRPATPEIRRLTAGDATARLFVNTLNAAAHSAYGVDAVVRIARHAPSYELVSSDLDATCELIRSVLSRQ